MKKEPTERDGSSVAKLICAGREFTIRLSPLVNMPNKQAETDRTTTAAKDDREEVTHRKRGASIQREDLGDGGEQNRRPIGNSTTVNLANLDMVATARNSTDPNSNKVTSPRFFPQKHAPQNRDSKCQRLLSTSWDQNKSDTWMHKTDTEKPKQTAWAENRVTGPKHSQSNRGHVFCEPTKEFYADLNKE